MKIPPWQVIVTRCFFFLIALLVFSFWSKNPHGVAWGCSLLEGGVIFSCLAGMITFFRSRWAHTVTAITLVLFPLCFFILMDLVIFSHSNGWCEIVIATVLWMVIPIAFTYDFLANKKVQTYYRKSQSLNPLKKGSDLQNDTFS